MVRKSKLNFLDSLLGGAVEGFQLSQDLKSKQQQRDLQERKFGIQEQQLGFNERQLEIQEQASEQARQNRQRTLDFISQIFGPGGIPGVGQQAPVPQQQAPAPVAQTRTQAIQQPAPAAPTIQEATELPIGGPATPPLAGRADIGGPSLRPTADQIQDTTDFGLLDQEPDIGVEKSPAQDLSDQFPRFNAELERIGRLQGLPGDISVSGKSVGIPIDFKISTPDANRTIRLLKRAFVVDQKGRGIEKFDILKFKKLIDDSKVRITDNFQKDLDKEFERQFRAGTSGRALAHFGIRERSTRKQEFLRDLGAEFGFIPDKLEKEANVALSGDRIKVNVKLGNDPKTGRAISRVGFALKDDPTDIIFVGKETIAGAGTQITVQPQIPSTLLDGITQSDLALKSVSRIDEILSRVDVDKLVGPIDAPIATLLESLGFPNADQQTIGNITRDLTDTLGRMRSGGVISEQEWETFTALVPQRSDPAPTFVNKLDDFRAKMNDIKSVNLDAAKTFGFNVGTSGAESGSGGDGSSRLQQLLEEKRKRAGTGG